MLQRGYQCTLCCHIFPTPWLVKTQIQHSSQEGYSCKGFYRRSRALGDQELKAREAAAPMVSMQLQQPGSCHGRALLHHSCQRQNELFQEQSALPVRCFCLHNTSAIL